MPTIPEAYTSVDGTTYAVIQSSSKMPAKCWGRYAHSAVLRVAPGARIPGCIRGNKSVDVLWDSGPGFAGKTSRCAADRAYESALDRARNYAANRDARIAVERSAGYLESLAERSGEGA